MTPKQARFVREYLIDLNATQAAIRCGYSERTAKQQGSRLLTNADIAEAVAKGQAKAAERLGLTLDGILQDINDIANEARAAAEFSPALTGKIALGKHLGMGLGVQKNQAVDENGEALPVTDLSRHVAFLLASGMKAQEAQPDSPALQ